MLCVRFSADGNFIYAGGADRQLRKWQVVSKEQAAINPMLVARFAHEAAVSRLERLGTNRLVTAEEGWKHMGVGAEIAAGVTELAFDYLDAPPMRVTQKDVPLPYAANLEALSLPNAGDIVEAAQFVCEGM